MFRAKRTPSLFCIIFEGRTGSSQFVSALNEHPQVVCYPEILNGTNVEIAKEILDSLASSDRVSALAPYADEPRYHPNQPPAEKDPLAIGLKTKLWDVPDIDAFGHQLEDHGFRLFYLRRKNILKSVVSEINSHRLFASTGQWNAERESDIPKTPLIIDPREFAERLNSRIITEWAHHSFYLKYPGPKAELFYEDMCDDFDGFMKSAFVQLMVKPRKTTGAFLKSTPDGLEQTVKNLNEIVEHISKDNWLGGIYRYLLSR